MLWLGSGVVVSCTLTVGGVVSSIATLDLSVSLPASESVAASVATQASGNPDAVSTVRTGVPLVASSNVAPGQSESHANVSGPPSGSNDAEPSSGTAVVGPWHSATYGPPAMDTGPRFTSVGSVSTLFNGFGSLPISPKFPSTP